LTPVGAEPPVAYEAGRPAGGATDAVGRGAVPVVRSAAGTLGLVAVVVTVSTAVAYEVTLRSGALVHNKMLPWILGRSLGVASYLTLTALVVLGIWLRHPWRNRLWSPRPESLLRAHVVLAACTVVLLAGHLASIALDHYAGVGWTGTFVPWQAQYRPTAVAIGTVAFYGIVLVAGTAALAGSLGRRVWFPIHMVSAMIFCLCLAHGAMAGTDSHTLRWLYVITGGVVAATQITRWVARRVGRHIALELE
jgi:sulfoxide reductase heme-binding subunit YedZ